ncbi:MAG: glucose-6-phosphate dehydrogenase, partial [Acidimicrobiia bacterium]|nr:glucose-6-phosphate dehydrogenase [Acidimicrobiia bacterium]
VTYRYLVGSFAEATTFSRLADLLAQCDRVTGTEGNRIYYLATVPRAFGAVAEGLGAAGLAAEPEGSFRRIVVEKPFGHDLGSSRALDEVLRAEFGERQIFRIDHYMAKETVQNILALRFTNAIFEPLWNRRYVDHVEITVAESAGIEHRGTFYEQSGALRDIVQNHVAQVLALTAMEPPASFSADAIRDEKVKVLRAVRRLDPSGLGASVVRCQYTRGAVGGDPVPGYRDEEGVAPLSDVETYLALRLEVDNWRWAGVPFYLRTGKRLARRVTEVVLRYRGVPHLPLPGGAADSLEPNTMRLRIQPDEGIELSFAAKVPGSAFRVRTVPLSFTYGASFAERRPEAYERVLFDALVGDATLFLRADEVDQAWQIVQPLVEAFDDNRVPLALYPAGSWGPHEADDILIGSDGWLTP